MHSASNCERNVYENPCLCATSIFHLVQHVELTQRNVKLPSFLPFSLVASAASLLRFFYYYFSQSDCWQIATFCNVVHCFFHGFSSIEHGRRTLFCRLIPFSIFRNLLLFFRLGKFPISLTFRLFTFVLLSMERRTQAHTERMPNKHEKRKISLAFAVRWPSRAF